jgi:hypothetical protein
MADWLSNIERKRQEEKAKEQRRREQSAWEDQWRRDHLTRSYQANKERIDEIYGEIEAYAKRAESMGFKVTLKRTDAILTITEPNPTPKGYTWIYIQPDGNKLAVTFMNYGYHERRYPLRRVTEWMIGEWIKWVVERGFKSKPPR